MFFRQIFEPKLAQYSYLIGCQQTREAVIIDPMRDIDRYINIANAEGLKIVAGTETHIHADYLSGLKEFGDRLKIQILVSDEGTDDWKYEWVKNGDYTSRLLKDGDTFQFGNIKFEIVHTPGHTPEHICYVVSDLAGGGGNPMGIISGDFVFVGDVGRPDLLESAAGMEGAMVPSAKELYESLQKFKSFQNYLQVWPGHGAGSACGKALGAVPSSTVGYELQFNPAIREAGNKDGFVNYILSGQPEPPMYFARMKFENKTGPKYLGKFPEPTRLKTSVINEVVSNDDTIIIDTRNWKKYKSGHLSGSIFAPMDSAFNTTVGCYVTPDKSIYLILEEDQYQEAVIDLIRIGLDNIQGFFTDDDLAEYKSSGGEFITSEDITATELKEMLVDENNFLLDVRRASELEEIGFIKGAYNIAHTQLYNHLEEVPKDKKIMVQCLSGNRSRYALSFLESNGYEAVNVMGGLIKWVRSGEKLVRETEEVTQ
ncbi:MAG: MBL fold metallo-hydrolase [Ignavibacterium sp.]|nr:MAG: MBL fold metallo-hydrolase [Ignavibacterium sp.]